MSKMYKIGNFHFYIYPPWHFLFGLKYSSYVYDEEYHWGIDFYFGPLFVAYYEDSKHNIGALE